MMKVRALRVQVDVFSHFDSESESESYVKPEPAATRISAEALGWACSDVNKPGRVIRVIMITAVQPRRAGPLSVFSESSSCLWGFAPVLRLGVAGFPLVSTL
jgi:hypothetical protein